jgi:hypothetical protein
MYHLAHEVWPPLHLRQVMSAYRYTGLEEVDGDIMTLSKPYRVVAERSQGVRRGKMRIGDHT